MGFGKHTSEGQTIMYLQEVIQLRDRELEETRKECAEQFRKIKELCFGNDYNGELDKLHKIEKIASDNFLALVNDLLISEQKEQAKIIELPTTRKNNK